MQHSKPEMSAEEKLAKENLAKQTVAEENSTRGWPANATLAKERTADEIPTDTKTNLIQC